MNDILLTAAQVAERLNCSKRTVYRMTEAGSLPPPIRYNRKLVRWRKSDIDAAIDGVPVIAETLPPHMMCTQCGDDKGTYVSLQINKAQRAMFRVECDRCGCFSHYLQRAVHEAAVERYLEKSRMPKAAGI